MTNLKRYNKVLATTTSANATSYPTKSLSLSKQSFNMAKALAKSVLAFSYDHHVTGERIKPHAGW